MGTKTYLTLTNLALNELNEVELTSSNFTSSRGIQTSAKNFINKAVNELYLSEIEWPWLHTNGTQVINAGQQEYTFPTAFRKADFDSFRIKPTELITNGEFTSDISNWTTVDGTPTYVSTGNGRLQLNDATVTQSISTVVNTKYRLTIRAFDTVGTGQAFKIQVGTVAEGTQNLNETLTVENFGNGAILATSFVATAQTTFVTINNPTTVTNMQVDFVRVSADEVPINLKYISYDAYIQGRYTSD